VSKRVVITGPPPGAEAPTLLPAPVGPPLVIRGPRGLPGPNNEAELRAADELTNERLARSWFVHAQALEHQVQEPRHRFNDDLERATNDERDEITEPLLLEMLEIYEFVETLGPAYARELNLLAPTRERLTALRARRAKHRTLRRLRR